MEFLDGSPLAGTRMLVLDAAVTEWSSVFGPTPADALLVASTDEAGEIHCSAADERRLDRPFRLMHLGAAAIPQNRSAYPLGAIGSIVHRIAAGRIAIDTVDEQGHPVAGANIRLKPTTGRPRVGISSADGTALFYLTGNCGFSVDAFQRDRRIGASVEDRTFDLRSPTRLQLMLLPMDGGMVRVGVVDQGGRPVEPFALGFYDHQRLVRYVRNSDLWQGQFVLGLPEIELDVRVVRVFTDRPAMYPPPKDDLRRVIPDADGTAEAQFEVALGSRLAFDLDSWRDGDERLRVRVYREEPNAESAWRRVPVWQFTDDGAISSIGIGAEGRWYTEVIEPGIVRVEVKGGDRAKPLLDQWVELAPDEVAVRALHVNPNGGG